MSGLRCLVDLPDDVRGVTLEERAKLVLLTLGRTASEIRQAYRKLAKRHHPDISRGGREAFQLISEAYCLLTGGRLPRRSLLADDEWVMKVAGRRVAPLLDKQAEWVKYERWRRARFYGEGVI
ncbi:MAG: J domain-containing protein [Kiritimatiellae bacterium]|nr:J domain-containing protein [Kiritimatiellia bacterium]